MTRNFGTFTRSTQQIWLNHVTPVANFEPLKLSPCLALHFRKSHLVSTVYLYYFQSYWQETSELVENTPSVLIGLNSTVFMGPYNYFNMMTANFNNYINSPLQHLPYKPTLYIKIQLNPVYNLLNSLQH